MTAVVKREHNGFVDDSSQPPHAHRVATRRRPVTSPAQGDKPDWSTFSKRLEWIVREKFDGNESKLAEAAGLKSRTNVNRAIKRGSVMLADAAAAVAQAAGVSLYWLAGHAPDPYSGVIADDSVDIFPTRREAIALARVRRPQRITEGAIARARTLQGTQYAGKTRAEWAEILWEFTVEELQEATRELNEQRASAPAASPTVDDEPQKRAKTA
jgi:hypothetical protein